jgi:UDP-N-acetylmuramoylalanine--D-glutamate ligase
MDVTGKHVIVVGLGKSGIAASRVAAQRGARVVATDRAELAELSPEVRELNARLALGGHAGVDFAGSDLIIVSPGVPNFPELERAERASVPVIGELGFAASQISAPILVVGGTNGKSTTTTLLGELLDASGLRVFVGGNLGRPACDAIGGEYDAVVFEASSFQLERPFTLKPRVSVLLNITEDHLDRYPNFEAYALAKGNAFVRQASDDFAIIPAQDAGCRAQAERGRGHIVEIGAPGGDFSLEGAAVVERATGEPFDLAACELHGRHNQLNAAFAIAAARAFGTEPQAIRRGLSRFRPLPHRMARVAELRGISFFDDSKGTNVGAAVTALLGLNQARAVLIAGGRDKLGSYAPLVAALEQKGRAVVLIGEAAEKIAGAIGSRLPVVRARDMQGAVRAAFELAQPGDAVLLSPACSSFDMFESYAERGRCFARAVQELKEELA